MQPTVQKVNESKSGFDGAFYDGEIQVVSKDLSNSEQFVSLKKPLRVLFRLMQL